MLERDSLRDTQMKQRFMDKHFFVRTRFYGLTVVFLLLVGLLSMSRCAQQEQCVIQELSPDVQSNLDKFREYTLQEVNCIRTQPQSYLEYQGQEAIRRESQCVERDPEADDDLISTLSEAEPVSSLRLNNQLNEAAQGHSEHMATTIQFAHSGIGDGALIDRIKGAGYTGRAFGENIAFDTRNVLGGDGDDLSNAEKAGLQNGAIYFVSRYALDCTVLDRGHLKNLLNPIWNELGIGQKSGQDDQFKYHYNTQNFGKSQ